MTTAMDGGIRDWLAGLTRRELLLMAALALAVLGAAGMWFARSGGPEPLSVEPVAAAPGPTPAPASVFVHVAGWVRNPGVYELPEGARVVDAIGLAGGPKQNADLTGLNLAAVLVDAQQVLVPRRVDQPVPVPGAPPAGVPAPGVQGADAQALVNVNTASLQELETLPGIGPVLGQRIIDFREQNGPFTSVDQLDEVSGIGPKTMESLRPLVTV